MKRRVIAASLMFVLCAAVLYAQAPAKNMAGTWKLDTAKSKYTPGPTPKSQVAKLDTVDGGMKVVSDRVEADGKNTHFEWTAKFDGKDYPVTGDPGRDAVSVKKIDDYTLDITNKKAGKVTTMIHAVYAKDGKSRTETVTGTDAQGRKIENVTQWTKQ
jgi:histidinol dehydrogenase